MTADDTPDQAAYAGWTFAQDAAGNLMPSTSVDVAWQLDRARYLGEVAWHYLGIVPIPPSGRWTVLQLSASLGPYFALPQTWLDAVVEARDNTPGEEPLY